MNKFLIVHSIFSSIQGESSFAGYPCLFIRFAGCNLNCSYCDSRFNRDVSTGTLLTQIQILKEVRKSRLKHVCLTGGEPLLQKGLKSLALRLLYSGYSVSLETNGSISISDMPKNMHIVMDIKCPGSGESKYFYRENLELLKPSDDIKFVITDQNDYIWAKNFVRKYSLNKTHRNVFFSPAFSQLNPKVLAGWMLKDSLDVRLHLQLHKLIGLE